MSGKGDHQLQTMFKHRIPLYLLSDTEFLNVSGCISFSLFGVRISLFPAATCLALSDISLSLSLSLADSKLNTEPATLCQRINVSGTILEACNNNTMHDMYDFALYR